MDVENESLPEDVAVWMIEVGMLVGDTVRRRAVHVLTDGLGSPPDLAAFLESFDSEARPSIRRLERVGTFCLNLPEADDGPGPAPALNQSRVELDLRMADLVVSAALNCYYGHLVHRDMLDATIAGHRDEVRKLEATIRALERSEPVPTIAGDDPAPATKAPGADRLPRPGRSGGKARKPRRQEA